MIVETIHLIELSPKCQARSFSRLDRIDASWVEDLKFGKSSFKYVFLLGGVWGYIMAKYKTNSSYYNIYIYIHNTSTTKEAMWLESLFIDL
jgi:hypothetical protein